MTKTKVTKRAVKPAEKVIIDERVEPAPVKTPAKKVVKVAPTVEAKPVEPPVKKADPVLSLEERLKALKLADARVRLQRAMDSGNPDEIIARMDEVFRLENE